jgi:centromeric protein E
VSLRHRKRCVFLLLTLLHFQTYTMMGSDSNPGIIPLTVCEIFDQIKNTEDREFLIRVGYIEIYNEKIFDLLEEKTVECTKIYETENGEVIVKQREIIATSPDEILKLYETGNLSRKIKKTNMNDRSSRSHTIFQITIESRDIGKTSDDGAVQVSHLNLVDLAGSEKAEDKSFCSDGKSINQSLLALGKVIRNHKNFINYRESKLTRILKDSLGGNAVTSIICTVTPVALTETYSTLRYELKLKQISH